jgi:adenylate cyclase
MEQDRRRMLAERAGVQTEYVDGLVELGILGDRIAGSDGEDFPGNVRRIRVVEGLEAGGIPLPVLAEALRTGQLSLDFVDQPSYDRFAGDAPETFRQLADRTGIPVELLLVVREATGSAQPGPDSHLRENELRIIPYLETLLAAGIRPTSIERSLRVAGDGMRRVAETESDWWRTEILEPLFRSGISAAEVGTRTERFATDTGPVTDDAMLALFHGQQAHAWMRNIFEGFEGVLVRAGLHAPLEHPPAICFFDVTGYSRLTEERGDEQAADLAARVARLVQRVSVAHGGKAVKWLGDGVMFHFREPAPAVLAALDMRDGVASDHLPPAHIGIHAGPVLFQEGDYFGRTVNAASRIADHAGRDQVLVSQDVVDAAPLDDVRYDPIGPVELKGLLAPLLLYSVRRAG